MPIPVWAALHPTGDQGAEEGALVVIRGGDDRKTEDKTMRNCPF